MKKFLLLFITSIILVSCGGGGGESGSGSGGGGSSAEYDMWDYLVSKTTIVKNFDIYITNSNYNPTGERHLNAGQLKETVLSSNTVKFEEIVNGKVVESQTLIVSSDTIQVVNGYTLNRYNSLNSSIGNCVVQNHYENYSPISGYILEMLFIYNVMVGQSSLPKELVKL